MEPQQLQQLLQGMQEQHQQQLQMNVQMMTALIDRVAGSLGASQGSQHDLPNTRVRSEVDPRIIGMFDSFSGRPEDFLEWELKFLSDASQIGARDGLQVAVDMPDVKDIRLDLLPDDETRARARAVYHILRKCLATP